MVQMLHVLRWDRFVVIAVLKSRHINKTHKNHMKTTELRYAEKVSHGLQTHLLETVVLFTVGTVPAVSVPIGHYCVLVTEPAVHVGMDGLLSAIMR